MDWPNDALALQKGWALQQALQERRDSAPLELEAKLRAMEAQKIQDAEIARKAAMAARAGPMDEMFNIGSRMGGEAGATNIMGQPVLGSQARQEMYDPNARQLQPPEMGPPNPNYQEAPMPNSDPWIQSKLAGILNMERNRPAAVERAINIGEPTITAENARNTETIAGREQVAAMTNLSNERIGLAHNQTLKDINAATNLVGEKRIDKTDTRGFLENVNTHALKANVEMKGAIDGAYRAMNDKNAMEYGSTGGVETFQKAITDLTTQMTISKQLKDADMAAASRMNVSEDVIAKKYAEFEQMAVVAYRQLVERHQREQAYLKQPWTGKVADQLGSLFGAKEAPYASDNTTSGRTGNW